MFDETLCGAVGCQNPHEGGLPVDEYDLWRNAATHSARDPWRGLSFVVCDECAEEFRADPARYSNLILKKLTPQELEGLKKLNAKKTP